MRPAFRHVAFLVFAGLILASAGCSSNNKGKIEGKWKLSSIPGMSAEQQKMMEGFKMYVYIDFSPSGTMSMGASSDDPTFQKLLSESKDVKTVTCKYKLLGGDGVEFYDMPKEMQSGGGPGGGLFGSKDKARTNVKIAGDTLTMTDSDGKSLSMTKIK